MNVNFPALLQTLGRMDAQLRYQHPEHYFIESGDDFVNIWDEERDAELADIRSRVYDSMSIDRLKLNSEYKPFYRNHVPLFDKSRHASLTSAARTSGLSTLSVMSYGLHLRALQYVLLNAEAHKRVIESLNNFPIVTIKG